MSNTTIQIKRSLINPQPSSLQSAELGYSYNSNTIFIGTPDGTGTIAIGGKSYLDLINLSFNVANAAFGVANSAGTTERVNGIYTLANSAYDTANAAFGRSNSIYDLANAAFDKANSDIDSANASNAYAESIGSAANNYAGFMANAANAYAVSIGIAGNTWANTVGISGNAYANLVGTSGNAYADLVGTSANNFAGVMANSSNGYAVTVGTSGNAYAVVVGASGNAYANLVGDSANNYAGAMANAANAVADATYVKLTSSSQTITGDLSITGNVFIGGNTTAVSANNLIVNDPLIYLANGNPSDILDIGFVGSYVNTGAAHVHTGLYRDHASKEYYLFQGYDANPESSNEITPYSNNMVNAVLHTDIVTGNLWLSGANATIWIGAAFDKANAANLLAYNTGVGANSYADSVGAAANLYADGVGTAANTNAANGSYISAGIVKVPYGGTGKTSFTTNGIVFGNNTGDLKVTAAGTEGQVLQANDLGVPVFGMLDGGSF
jgi:hypothetical protein